MFIKSSLSFKIKSIQIVKRNNNNIVFIINCYLPWFDFNNNSIFIIKIMKNSKREISSNQKEFIEFLENASNQETVLKEKNNNLKSDEIIHLNSLITKNISLFTKNPNYKMLAWLITQLLIFSLFVLAMTVFRNNFIPYINNL